MAGLQHNLKPEEDRQLIKLEKFNRVMHVMLAVALLSVVSQWMLQCRGGQPAPMSAPAYFVPVILVTDTGLPGLGRENIEGEIDAAEGLLREWFRDSVAIEIRAEMAPGEWFTKGLLPGEKPPRARDETAWRRSLELVLLDTPITRVFITNLPLGARSATGRRAGNSLAINHLGQVVISTDRLPPETLRWIIVQELGARIMHQQGPAADHQCPARPLAVDNWKAWTDTVTAGKKPCPRGHPVLLPRTEFLHGWISLAGRMQDAGYTDSAVMAVRRAREFTNTRKEWDMVEKFFWEKIGGR